VTRRSESVAFVVAESEDRVFTDPFFLGMLRGAHDAIAAEGLQLVLVILSGAHDVAQFEQYARGGHVDGVLLLSLHGTDALPSALVQMGVPTVLSGRPFGDVAGIRYVDADNYGGGRLAAQQLLECGVRSPATITGPFDMTAARDRYAGYRDTLLAGGVRPLKRRMAHSDFTIEAGEAAMHRLLTLSPDIDGVFAASDRLAIGAIRALQATGRRVPQDVPVVGFDDSREGQLNLPALTTVRQPLDVMGAAMARMLLAALHGAPEPTKEIVEVELVRRATA
jgi:DNA-binding LacI/PurR family transcriptional regulator